MRFAYPTYLLVGELGNPANDFEHNDQDEERARDDQARLRTVPALFGAADRSGKRDQAERQRGGRRPELKE
jgi:hypothetical protein